VGSGEWLPVGWENLRCAEMMATVWADGEAAFWAEAVVDIGRGIAASMGVVVAFEAFLTWNTSSCSGILFLLILLVRPLVLALVQSIPVFLVNTHLLLLGSVILFDVPGAGLLTHRLVFIFFSFSLLLLLGITVSFNILLRILILGLLLLFCMRIWWECLRRWCTRIWRRWMLRTSRMRRRLARRWRWWTGYTRMTRCSRRLKWEPVGRGGKLGTLHYGTHHMCPPTEKGSERRVTPRSLDQFLRTHSNEPLMLFPGPFRGGGGAARDHTLSLQHEPANFPTLIASGAPSAEPRGGAGWVRWVETFERR
jgi:hypothetical protein